MTHTRLRFRSLLAVAGAFAGALPALAVELTPPPLENKAYVLMDDESGQVLASFNPDEPLPPASLTKMMTSYLVEQALKSGRLKPDDQILVSEYAWCRGTNAESCMYLPLNSHASVMDILRGIVIQSGNDAAKAAAEHLAGSEPSFAQLMNKEAQRLGMTKTHFVNATGLPAPDHKASARDLAVLARAIIHDSAAYYPLYAEKSFTFNNIKQGNRNALLYTDPTVDGLKTGHTAEAGYCLTASAKRGDMRLISVVMGTSSAQARADQSRALFNWGFASFEKAQPAAANQTLQAVPIKEGVKDTVNAGIAQAWTVLVPHGQAATVKTSFQLNPDLKGPIAKGAVLGKVLATVDGKPLAERPLVALEPVERAGFFKRLWQRILGWFGK
jgi:D-alanyl-D-alanine carboxypeptidase (penicillin-binding protein 5/6)